MKRNVNVFIAVVLVAVLCGGIIWLRTANDEKLGWNIHDTYGEAPAYSNNGAAYTNATFAGPSNDGGVMTLSPSRTMRHSAAPSYAGAYTISYGVNSMPLTSNLSPLTSGGAGGGQGLYTTSTKTFNSYGGGGNGGAAMGGAMSNGRSNSGISNPSLQGGAGIGSISPIAYSTARRSDMTVAAGENLAQIAAENPVMVMTNAANAGMGTGMYGGIGYTTVDSYGSAMYGSPAGIRGRRNVGGIDDNYLGWLSSGLWEYGDGYDGITMEELRALYVAATGDTDFSNQAEWEAFLAWFNMKQSDDTFGWYWVPISDAIPFLLLLCAIWALVVYRRTRIQESQCKEKSQL